ncbi:unnamed protein product [Allacma fusca]|uniref:CRAL-TRIO domain-containing protein n=1 Tax=Allacma fusca TaxID=39272 RepID=A0A8J2MC30_9HEXA|nr:unnamed protein product [Allacma fusca]
MKILLPIVFLYCLIFNLTFTNASVQESLKLLAAQDFSKDYNDTKEYNEVTSNLLQEDLDQWKPPEEFRSEFTYYWSGVDEDCRPIWVGQMGRWNVRRVVERGEKSRENFRKYIEQMVYNIGKSVKLNKNTTSCSNPEEEVTGIIDLEGFNYFQLSSVSTVDFILSLFKEFVPVIIKHVYGAYVVNATYVVEALVRLIRPILGSLMERLFYFDHSSKRPSRNKVTANLVEFNRTEVNSNFLQNDLDNWKAPEELRRSFIYYWSGIDEDCRPIWIGQLGQWNVQKVIDEGLESKKTLRKYIDQMVHNVMKTLKSNYSGCENVNEEITGIIDLEGFNWHQMSSAQTIVFILSTFKEFIPVVFKHVESVFVVNTNYMAKALLNLIRPLLGSFMERVEIFGTHKQHWLPHLLKRFPRNELPEWYGGDKNFAPIQVFG